MAANGQPSGVENLPKGTVLIAGGGPVGLLVATILSRHDVKSVLLERNESTTKWPKMDLTNGRSMEILRRLGLSDRLREHGVAAHIPQPVLFSTGLPAESAITKWNHPSVNEFRERIGKQNDGSLPQEAWQRVSQVLFEAWLKELCDKDDMIDLRFGSRVLDVKEQFEGAITKVQNTSTGEELNITSDYVVGCDGASSKVRQSLEFPLDGGPVPAYVLLIHFKSRDLARLHKQGQFWHVFFLQEAGGFSGAIIAQDEVDTWTVHMFLPLDTDDSTIDSHEAIYKALGGCHGSYEIKIDEILIRSTWRPNIAVARKWSSDSNRVFIAGDAAHQLIPTGGYGMNTGIGDAYDISWKLAAVITGYAGGALLQSYEAERRPVALRNSERSGAHLAVHQEAGTFLQGCDLDQILRNSPETEAVRQKIHQHYQDHDGENTDFGIELGYRYDSSVIIPELANNNAPAWNPSSYHPTTWPGSRPPHVLLGDGTSIFDHFHPTGWTLVVFSDTDLGAKHMVKAAAVSGVPLKQLQLSAETHAKSLWERDLVLVRPDQHVAWRGSSVASLEEAQSIIERVTGHKSSASSIAESPEKPKVKFAGTESMTSQIDKFVLEKASSFQQ